MVGIASSLKMSLWLLATLALGPGVGRGALGERDEGGLAERAGREQGLGLDEGRQRAAVVRHEERDPRVREEPRDGLALALR